MFLVHLWTDNYWISHFLSENCVLGLHHVRVDQASGDKDETRKKVSFHSRRKFLPYDLTTEILLTEISKKTYIIIGYVSYFMQYHITGSTFRVMLNSAEFSVNYSS